MLKTDDYTTSVLRAAVTTDAPTILGVYEKLYGSEEIEKAKLAKMLEVLFQERGKMPSRLKSVIRGTYDKMEINKDQFINLNCLDWYLYELNCVSAITFDVMLEYSGKDLPRDAIVDRASECAVYRLKAYLSKLYEGSKQIFDMVCKELDTLSATKEPFTEKVVQTVTSSAAAELIAECSKGDEQMHTKSDSLKFTDCLIAYVYADKYECELLKVSMYPTFLKYLNNNTQNVGELVKKFSYMCESLTEEERLQYLSADGLTEKGVALFMNDASNFETEVDTQYLINHFMECVPSAVKEKDFMRTIISMAKNQPDVLINILKEL